MSSETSRVEKDMALDFEKRMSYGDYLKLDTLLSAQAPLSEKQDETLFIIVHHVQELWLNLIIHELEFAMSNLREDKAGYRIQGPGKDLARSGTTGDSLGCAVDHDAIGLSDVPRHIGAGVRISVLPVSSGGNPAGREGCAHADAAISTVRRSMSVY